MECCVFFEGPLSNCWIRSNWTSVRTAWPTTLARNFSMLDTAARMLARTTAKSELLMLGQTRNRKVTATWPVSSQRPGDAAFDESTQRLLMGTHTPPQMIAMDATTGKEVASLPTVEGMDGVYFDTTRKRIYISGGRGSEIGYVYTYQQINANRYEIASKIPTRPGAGTSFWSPELDRYYVAAPAHDNDQAAVLVFEPQP